MHKSFIDGLKKISSIDILEIDNFQNLVGSIKNLADLDKTEPFDRIKYKLDNLTEFVEKLKQGDYIFSYEKLIIEKLYETIKLHKEPIIIITVLKNSIGNEPNYDILQKIETDKGFKIHKFLQIIFQGNDDLVEVIKMIQLLTQREFTFEKVMIQLIKIIFINYTNQFEIKSKSWQREFINKDTDFKDTVLFCMDYYTDK